MRWLKPSAAVSYTHLDVYKRQSQGRALAQQLNEKRAGIIFEKENFKSNVEAAWETCDALVFIMAAGIVVRTIAPLVRKKTLDPAVVVMDQKGAFAISLLSGHLGGCLLYTSRCV